MNTRRRGLHVESLEDRRLLSINWYNAGSPGDDADDFESVYGAADAAVARAIVRRAVSDWEDVIDDHNFDDSGLQNTFTLLVGADDLGGSALGSTSNQLVESASRIPYFALVTLDDDGGEEGWFFDETPTDDAEFPGIANEFQASFIDGSTAGQAHRHDFYRTVVHEIGHALGIYLVSGEPLSDLTTYGGEDQVSGDDLRVFHNSSGTYGVTVTLSEVNGGHIYEGPVDSNYPSTPTHPHELLNDGRAITSSTSAPYETTRQWISDLDAKLLADAYGYTVNLPSSLATAHASLDLQTGTLLVQGLPGSVSEDFDISLSSGTIEVTVESTSESFPEDDVDRIIIAGNGGSDSFTVASSLTSMTEYVDYVVSSNVDATESGTVGDGVVDLDSNVPGNQTALRAALQDIGTGTAAVYLPGGQYDLQLSGSGGITQGDLDITGDVTLIGSGAGSSVVNAASLSTDDRIFEIASSDGNLDLSRVTLSGGSATVSPSSNQNGGAIRVTSGGTATITDAAFTDNSALHDGGAVYVAGSNSSVSVDRGVFSGNSADRGGALFVSDSGTATVTDSIVADNPASTGPDLYAYTSGSLTSTDNLLTTAAGGPGSTTSSGDYVGSPDQTVTSQVDSFNHADDAAALSLREAIDLTNLDDDSLEEIWLPAWDFHLTRDRGDAQYDMDISYGDLDISDSLKLRGLGSSLTSVRWKSGEVDAVFDLLGDYNGNGISGGTTDNGYVTGSDYLKWQTQNGNGDSTTLNAYSADGDDDGDVDSDDYTVWQEHYTNTLSLVDLNQILA